MRTYDELENTHFPWILNSTLAIYEKGRLKCVHEIESGIILLPKVLPEREIPRFQRQMQQCIMKSLYHSLWVGDDSMLYRESDLHAHKSLLVGTSSKTPNTDKEHATKKQKTTT
jgi:hypothetical protein